MHILGCQISCPSTKFSTSVFLRKILYVMEMLHKLENSFCVEGVYAIDWETDKYCVHHKQMVIL